MSTQEMAEAKREITIDRPREDAFTFLANAENGTQWETR